MENPDVSENPPEGPIITGEIVWENNSEGRKENCPTKNNMVREKVKVKKDPLIKFIPSSKLDEQNFRLQQLFLFGSFNAHFH